MKNLIYLGCFTATAVALSTPSKSRLSDIYPPETDYLVEEATPFKTLHVIFDSNASISLPIKDHTKNTTTDFTISRIVAKGKNLVSRWPSSGGLYEPSLFNIVMPVKSTRIDIEVPTPEKSPRDSNNEIPFAKTSPAEEDTSEGEPPQAQPETRKAPRKSQKASEKRPTPSPKAKTSEPSYQDEQASDKADNHFPHPKDERTDEEPIPVPHRGETPKATSQPLGDIEAETERENPSPFVEIEVTRQVVHEQEHTYTKVGTTPEQKKAEKHNVPKPSPLKALPVKISYESASPSTYSVESLYVAPQTAEFVQPDAPKKAKVRKIFRVEHEIIQQKAPSVFSVESLFVEPQAAHYAQTQIPQKAEVRKNVKPVDHRRLEKEARECLMRTQRMKEDFDEHMDKIDVAFMNAEATYLRCDKMYKELSAMFGAQTSPIRAKAGFLETISDGVLRVTRKELNHQSPIDRKKTYSPDFSIFRNIPLRPTENQPSPLSPWPETPSPVGAKETLKTPKAKRKILFVSENKENKYRQPKKPNPALAVKFNLAGCDDFVKKMRCINRAANSPQKTTNFTDEYQ